MVSTPQYQSLGWVFSWSRRYFKIVTYFYLLLEKSFGYWDSWILLIPFRPFFAQFLIYYLKSLLLFDYGSFSNISYSRYSSSPNRTIFFAFTSYLNIIGSILIGQIISSYLCRCTEIMCCRQLSIIIWGGANWILSYFHSLNILSGLYIRMLSLYCLLNFIYDG